MGLGDKMSNAAQEAKGRAKAGAGAASGDREQEAEGHREETEADLKQRGEHIKDAFKK